MQARYRIENFRFDINEYEIIKKIGSGGFASIYLVQEKGKNKPPIAAKSIFMSDSEHNTELFTRTLAILMRISAPTILRFHGFSPVDFQDHDSLTIFTDFAANGSLAEMINNEENVMCPPEYDATQKQIILCGIAHGMMILHSHGVLHRDLNPNNVLLDAHFHPLITGFSLSKFINPSSPRRNSMSGCGTIAYMAPEVIEGTDYGIESDVFSFGILMFEVITGQRAFDAKSMRNLFEHHSKVLHGYRPTFTVPVKPSLRSLIERCWDADPFKRPTFTELFYALSLSEEADNSTLEFRLQTFWTQHCEHSEPADSPYYSLEGVDVDRVLDYVSEITSNS